MRTEMMTTGSWRKRGLAKVMRKNWKMTIMGMAETTMGIH